LSHTYDKKNIEERLKKLIQIILEDETMDIDPEKSLILDYGLDSLDLLDFSFSIEEIFGVKIGANELRGRARGTTTEEEMFDENGYISQKALKALRDNIPEVDPGKLSHGLRQEDIPKLLNIKVFTRIVFDKCTQ